MQPIHPFPARMTPDTVRQLFSGLSGKAIVLDPMCGSGTVVRHAARSGICAVGFDIDPLSVLMSRVWTTKTPVRRALSVAENLVRQANGLRMRDCDLPWIDHCPETKRFTKYWFANPQRRQLRRISHLLMHEMADTPSYLRNCLWLALSRLIVTKHAGASLAWDVSHSRPHKVREENDFDVDLMFVRSTAQLVQRLSDDRIDHSARIRIGDCRNLASVERHSIDAVVTSPPYLNAIDYLRGHKMSLVWMGYTIPSLRNLRAKSIGTEAARSNSAPAANCEMALGKLAAFPHLPARQQNIVRKYADDASIFLAEMHRVIKPGGRMSLVLGDSNVRGQRIENSKLFFHLARQIGFRKTAQSRRQLQENHRYLPIISKNNSLENRMRYEIIQTYVAP